jgi:hypothetical protein
MKVEYSSNNSGGTWWLKDKDWKSLEEAGWKVNWFKDSPHDFIRVDKDGRWLGALAAEATREGLSLKMAIAEWEDITGQNPNATGCACCGEPHNFRAIK